MSITPFVYSSTSLPKLKAKQLTKAFRFLKLSAAQEATAKALGYSSWYECIHRGILYEPSQSDQDAGIAVRVARYHHQANVLRRLGVTPSDADLWVRAWGLTGKATLAPGDAMPLYYQWKDALDEFEIGQINADQLVARFGSDADMSKYPDIDRPTWVCSGVVLGPTGKYPHYAIDPVLQKRIPIYLRGPSCVYHIEDDYPLLEVFLPDLPKSVEALKHIRLDLSRIQYEWHFGRKHPDAPQECIPRLVTAALRCPDEMMVISVRAMPQHGDRYDFERAAVACLCGRDFASFLQNRGDLADLAVTWYSDVEDAGETEWFWSLEEHSWFDKQASLPIFKAAHKHHPSSPVYSYPFKNAPMSSDEYDRSSERTCLLPLIEDYAEYSEENEEVLSSLLLQGDL